MNHNTDRESPTKVEVTPPLKPSVVQYYKDRPQIYNPDKVKKSNEIRDKEYEKQEKKFHQLLEIIERAFGSLDGVELSVYFTTPLYSKDYGLVTMLPEKKTIKAGDFINWQREIAEHCKTVSIDPSFFCHIDVYSIDSANPSFDEKFNPKDLDRGSMLSSPSRSKREDVENVSTKDIKDFCDRNSAMSSSELKNFLESLATDLIILKNEHTLPKQRHDAAKAYDLEYFLLDSGYNDSSISHEIHSLDLFIDSDEQAYAPEFIGDGRFFIEVKRLYIRYLDQHVSPYKTRRNEEFALVMYYFESQIDKLDKEMGEEDVLLAYHPNEIRDFIRKVFLDEFGDNETLDRRLQVLIPDDKKIKKISEIDSVVRELFKDKEDGVGVA